ncbi:MAG: hypothetical protein B1H02_02840 [Candidatus Latescibacteria bacterium 4484_107]|nr:MAG: hypothetical protein B1H02_02840 [Candidatus Latescibacteria bacterium 4484_107]
MANIRSQKSEVRSQKNLFWILYSVFFILILFSPQTGFATEEAGAFLSLGVGARAIGLGGAFSAMADDGTAFYWNPAGLARLSRPEVTMMYSSLFGLSDALANHHVLAYAHPLRGIHFSAGWIRLSVDDIPRFPELTYKNTKDRSYRVGGLHPDTDLQGDGVPMGYFTDREDAVYLSFSKMNTLEVDMGWQYFAFRLRLPVGVSFKFLNYSIGEASGRGVGIDIGSMLLFGVDELLDNAALGKASFGLVIQDVANTAIIWKSKYQDTIPTNVKFGAAYDQPIPSFNSRATLLWEIESKYKGTHHVGLEYTYAERLALRIGYDEARVSAGMGVTFWRFRMDYALSNYDLGIIHRASASLRF